MKQWKLMPFVLALVLLLSACGGQTTQGESKPAMDTQTQVSEPAVNQQQSGIDFEIGLRNVKIDTEGTSLTDAQKQVLQFFDTDYLNVYDYEFFRRYPSLRHTHATMLAERGASPKYVQYRLGHKNIQVTMQIYQHLTDKMSEAGARLLDTL